MFFGEYRHVLDSKNRVIIPSRLREAMGQETEGLVFYITPGQDRCLYLYPQETFDAFMEGMDFGLLIGEKKRLALRKFFANVARRVCDKQGRVQIPEKLIKSVGLGAEVIFVGFKDRIELWDAPRYKEFEENGLQDFGKLAEELIGDQDKEL